MSKIKEIIFNPKISFEVKETSNSRQMNKIKETSITERIEDDVGSIFYFIIFFKEWCI